MPKPQKTRDVIRFLRQQGWVMLREGKGSHEIWGHPSGNPSLSIPRHKEVSAGIIRQIIHEFPEAPKSWR